jgi:hypothetical protein
MEARWPKFTAKREMAREARELGKGKGYSKQANSTVLATEVQQASKSGLSGEVQSQAGIEIAPHRTGIGRQTYASAARIKTSGGANQTTAGDGRRGM